MDEWITTLSVTVQPDRTILFEVGFDKGVEHQEKTFVGREVGVNEHWLAAQIRNEIARLDSLGVAALAISEGLFDYADTRPAPTEGQIARAAFAAKVQELRSMTSAVALGAIVSGTPLHVDFIALRDEVAAGMITEYVDLF